MGGPGDVVGSGRGVGFHELVGYAAVDPGNSDRPALCANYSSRNGAVLIVLCSLSGCKSVAAELWNRLGLRNLCDGGACSDCILGRQSSGGPVGGPGQYGRLQLHAAHLAGVYAGEESGS